MFVTQKSMTRVAWYQKQRAQGADQNIGVVQVSPCIALYYNERRLILNTIQ